MIHSLHCGQVCVHTTQRETRRTLRYAKGSPFGRAVERSETERAVWKGTPVQSVSIPVVS